MVFDRLHGAFKRRKRSEDVFQSAWLLEGTSKEQNTASPFDKALLLNVV